MILCLRVGRPVRTVVTLDAIEIGCLIAMKTGLIESHPFPRQDR